MLTGIKPSIQISPEELKEFEILINETTLKDELGMVTLSKHKKGMFLVYNKTMVRRIILKNIEFFLDFNVQLLHDEQYVQNYLKNIDSGSRNQGEQTKAGLLFGYPKRSVLAFKDKRIKKNEDVLVLHQYGFSFISSRADRNFHKQIADIYEKTGLSALIEEYKLKWRTDTNNFLNSFKRQIEVVQHNESYYLDFQTASLPEYTYDHSIVFLNKKVKREAWIEFLEYCEARFDFDLPHNSQREKIIKMYSDLVDKFSRRIKTISSNYLPYVMLRCEGEDFYPTITLMEIRKDKLLPFIKQLDSMLSQKVEKILA